MASGSPPPDDAHRAGGADRALLGTAAAAVALGLWVLADSFAIPLGSGYDRVGPRFFPWLVGAGLLLSGTLLARGALRAGRAAEPASPEGQRATRTLALGLAASAVLLERAGFVATAALLFWVVARAFSSRRPLRDAVAGLLLAVGVYLAFTRGLGLSLPAGLFGGL